MQTAQQQFDQAVNAERGRFLVETVRNDAGGVRKINAPASRARAEEGGGFVVVTVLTSRGAGAPGFRLPTDRPRSSRDLQILLSGPGAIQALEVVWVPSDPNDVMSSAEMAVKFPTLKPIAPTRGWAGAPGGYCKTVFAAELAQCPNWGRRRSSAPHRSPAGIRVRPPSVLHPGPWRSTGTSPSRATWARANRASSNGSASPNWRRSSSPTTRTLPADFYGDMKRWAFSSQLFFLVQRYKIHRASRPSAALSFKTARSTRTPRSSPPTSTAKGHIDARDLGHLHRPLRHAPPRPAPA